MRRTLHVGAQSGPPVEDLGVQPDVRHTLTRDDVLAGNVDLFSRAGQILAGMPVRRLQVAATAGPGGSLTVELDVANSDRADVYVDGRPRGSPDVTGTSTTINLTGLATAQLVRVEGFAAGRQVAARTLRV